MHFTNVDINLICRNNEERIKQTLESISAQTYEDFRVLVIDDASSDATPDIVHEHIKQDKRFAYTRNDCRLYIGNFQRAFWEGDAPFVMPKSADDHIDKTYLEKCMARLQEGPELVMCHTASEVIGEGGKPPKPYPDKCNLRILDESSFTRALKMAATYTFAPSYWGVYRREAVAKLAPISYCNGFDHIVMCELALYGKTDYVDEILFHRSKGGSPLAHNAKIATLPHIRDLSIETLTADFSYLTPVVTMILGHIEMARIARIDETKRPVFITGLTSVLADRFQNEVRREVTYLLEQMPAFLSLLSKTQIDHMVRSVYARELFYYFSGIELVLKSMTEALKSSAMGLEGLTVEEKPQVFDFSEAKKALLQNF